VRSVASCWACRADFVCPNHRLLRAGYAWRMRVQGYPVLVWTVNDPARLAAPGTVVDGLITDEVEVCLAAWR
jgi:glycerophosphoryl diester phosphodiesterase